MTNDEREDSPQAEPLPTSAEVGPLLRKSAVLGVAALMTAGEAVKTLAGQVGTKIRRFADEKSQTRNNP